MEAAVMAVGSLTSGLVSSSARGAAAASGSSNSGNRRPSLLRGGVRRLNAHSGLKTLDPVMATGMNLSTEQMFADFRARTCAGRSASSKGGALASTCDVASEIFTIVPIMSVLVMVGIGIGFVLLRVEAAIEESE